MVVLGWIFLANVASQGRELEVYAAASLRESFELIARRFEKVHPGIAVHLEFGGSQDLAAQINQGAPADVFASAAPKNLGQVAYDPATRRVFALNRLAIVSPSASGHAFGFHDLAAAKSIVLAAPAVPVGAYAREAMRAAARRYGAAWLNSVNSRVVSEESDVRAVLTKVELGEADAGIVYATDARAGGGKVRTVAVPDEFQPRIEYPVAVMKNSKMRRDAFEFIQEVMGPSGQASLARLGFRSPASHGGP